MLLGIISVPERAYYLFTSKGRIKPNVAVQFKYWLKWGDGYFWETTKKSLNLVELSRVIGEKCFLVFIRSWWLNMVLILWKDLKPNVVEELMFWLKKSRLLFWKPPMKSSNPSRDKWIQLLGFVSKFVAKWGRYLYFERGVLSLSWQIEFMFSMGMRILLFWKPW